MIKCQKTVLPGNFIQYVLKFDVLQFYK